MQEEVVQALRGIGIDGRWPDGKPVLRESVRGKALHALHSLVPEQVMAQVLEVGEEETKELHIRLVLDATSDDPRVTQARLEDMFTPSLPAPRE